MKNSFVLYLFTLIILTSIANFATLRVSPTPPPLENEFKMKDQFGRVRIYHGVNVVYKLPPYIPFQDKFDPFLSLSDEDIKYFKEFGFNVVRLGTMWEAIEKEEGKYDSELLDRFYNLVMKLGENGIYTIIDAHQDIVSRSFCGEGVPSFYIDKLDYDKTCNGSLFKRFLHLIGVCKGIGEFNFKKDELGRPLLSECHGHFIDLHTSPDVTSAYYKLYNNVGGILDSYVSFWKVLASKFKNNEYVIGYDLWNEPFPGNLYDNILRLIPGKTDNEQLLNFYRVLDKGIREVDSNYVMMFNKMTMTL